MKLHLHKDNQLLNTFKLSETCSLHGLPWKPVLTPEKVVYPGNRFLGKLFIGMTPNFKCM
jgi:hypothetical protein